MCGSIAVVGGADRSGWGGGGFRGLDKTVPKTGGGGGVAGLMETGAEEEREGCLVVGGEGCVWKDGVCGKVVKL